MRSLRTECTARPRRGFTLLEVLVVILILGVLGSLLLAAVQMARAAALRSRCADNLRQIGLAFHQYHDTHSFFPPGVSRAPVFWEKDADPYPLLNWDARLLPYLDQEALWKQVEDAYAVDRRHLRIPPHVGAAVHLQIFVCPAEPPVVLPGVAPEHTLGSTSYLGNSGINEFRLEGILFTDSRIRMADILDGSSNTLLVGERPPARDLSYGRWYGGWGPWGRGNAFLGVRETDIIDTYHGCSRGPYHFAKGRLDDPCSIYFYWSLHPGGANFLFADGSVRFLSYAVDSVMPALATRAGGETVSIPD